MKELQAPQAGEFLLYETEDGRTRVECRFAEDTLWLSQAMMAELFQTSPQNITLHLKALYSDGEITPEATCQSYLQVRPEVELLPVIRNSRITPHRPAGVRPSARKLGNHFAHG